MRPTMSWHQTLAWKFFLRQAATILAIISTMLWMAYHQAGRGARAAAGSTLSAGGQVVARAFEQQGKYLDAGLEVFTQYSGNVAIIEQAQEARSSGSLTDTLVDNLPRLSADIAIVVKPDGTLLASTIPGAPTEFQDVGILQMALAPEEAKAAGYPGPSYRGFLRVGWGPAPGVYHAVARPLRSPGSASLGAMLVGNRLDNQAATDLRRLAIAGPRRGEPAAHLVLLSHFQTLGATIAQAGELDRLLARDPAFLAERARALDNQNASLLPLTIDGRPYLGMLSPLRGVNSLDLEMADFLMMPMEPLLLPFRTLQRAILGAGVAGIFIALGLGLRSARKVTAPLQALVSATEALAEGHAPAALPLVSGADEVGVLTRAFRSMQSELQAKGELLALLEKARLGSLADPPALAAVPSLAERVRDPMPAPAAWQGEAPVLPAPLREGRVFAGRYRVDLILGQGGMGVVLKVRDLQLDEDVALKVIRAGLVADPMFLEQLKQEIRMARRISHRFVLRTHDFGEAEGFPFVTMEYLKGTTLRSLLDARGTLPLPLVLRIARQVAEGLEAAHAVNVIHRDIKPMNVLFDLRGDVKIMDFGLAAPPAATFPYDSATIRGTPRYMAPEQVRGQQVDGRTDLYALGIMLFELCAGVPPFASPTVDELFAMHLHAPAPALGDLVPELPQEFCLLVARLTAKRREDRPQSAAEVVEILKILAAGGNHPSRV
jgi:serine/threonine-protein kinase